jgi:hypothetical protein
MARSSPDAVFLYHGTVCQILGKTMRAVEWLAERLPREAVCGPRIWYIKGAEVLPLVAEMRAEGFAVEVSQQGPSY